MPWHYELTFAPDLKGDVFTGRERIDVDLQRPTSVIEQLFDPLSYQKAGAVLEMTERYIRS